VAIFLRRSPNAWSRVVRCTVCGFINRLPWYSISRRPICGNCREALPEPGLTKGLRHLYRFRVLIGIGVVGAALVLLARWAPLAPSPSTPSPSAHISAPASPPVEIKQPVPVAEICATHPRPSEGLYWPDVLAGPFARLTIKTSPGSDYFVKMEDADGFMVAAFFIYGGSTFETKMPLGNFFLKYASGTSWCGADELFGPNTPTYKADYLFHFGRRQTPDGVESDHHTVELILQIGGNLQTRRLPRNEF
jgi:hypothetical protein